MTTKPLKYTAKTGVISFFYIKPQQQNEYNLPVNRCVISYFYIKPQQADTELKKTEVVLYLTSTSNHN